MGIRDKIFDSETIAALGHALDDEKDRFIGEYTIKFFTAAIAQGKLHFLPRDIIPNIL